LRLPDPSLRCTTHAIEYPLISQRQALGNLQPIFGWQEECALYPYAMPMLGMPVSFATDPTNTRFN